MRNLDDQLEAEFIREQITPHPDEHPVYTCRHKDSISTPLRESVRVHKQSNVVDCLFLLILPGLAIVLMVIMYLCGTNR
jgi:hypothetical protein